MGANKKLVARILKSEPLILKSKPLILCPLKTRLKTAPNMQTKTAAPPRLVKQPFAQVRFGLSYMEFTGCVSVT
jgi:hypothetical protein